MKYLIGFLLVAVGISAYVRLMPISPTAVTQNYVTDTDLPGGFVAVREFSGNSSDALARVKAIALATPRTVRVAQNPLTFVTRSAGFGFPDITQVMIQNDKLIIHAHLVYGKSDLGVNKTRVLEWLDAIGPL
ncbi:MAG: DUF1499 domain-containing protein [Yoonia sp.]|mgnify:FL=1|nr:DUF1499 domain-containing protein [Yoonia sp.]